MCCGKQRQQFQATAPVNRGTGLRRIDNYRESKRYSHAYFQYLGRTGIIVQGPVSGMRYRFEGYGAVAAVDPRDRRSLATVPNLRQVRGPAWQIFPNNLLLSGVKNYNSLAVLQAPTECLVAGCWVRIQTYMYCRQVTSNQKNLNNDI